MTDLDEDYDDDWGQEYEDDDEPHEDWEKDEPNCHHCMDTGPCRHCQPSPTRRLWWRLTDPVRGRWRGWRMRRRGALLDEVDPRYWGRKTATGDDHE